jgi:hypothetical protein
MSLDTAGNPCHYTTDNNWDVFKPTTAPSATKTTANRCSHVQIYAKTSSIVNMCNSKSSIGSCPRELCGWREVRSIPSNRGSWHPATDKLTGSSVYGTAYRSNEAWSVKFDNTHFD